MPNREVSPGDQAQGGHAGGITAVTGMGAEAVAMATESWGARTGVNTDSPSGRTRMEGRWGGASLLSPPTRHAA